jgi:urease accessory protein
MMDQNKFGKTSQLYLKAVNKDGNTILTDVGFTAPFKIMQPFLKQNGGLRVMYLAASAGIMAGDTQRFILELEDETDVELLSQSYEKIHKMGAGYASREMDAAVGSRACFCFNPQPMIPFRDSAFQGQTRIRLHDKTSRLFFSEILTCGRYARQELFAYRYFKNVVDIYRENQLIYRDNCRYAPQAGQMDGIGMYESYYHLANIFMTGMKERDSFTAIVYDLLECSGLEGGLTRLWDGDYSMRIMSKKAQQLEELTTKIAEHWYEMQ